MNRLMLFVGLPLDATDIEVQSLHQSIDNFYNRERNGGLSPQELQNLSGANNSDEDDGAAPAPGAAAPSGVDAEGLPWDHRIHSSNQKKSGNGVWVKRRGVSDTDRARIVAEIRATLAAGATAPAAVAAAVTTPAAGLPAMPGANVALPGLPGAAATPQLDPVYAQLVDIITRNLITPANPQGKINDAWVTQALAGMGIADGNLQNAAHAGQAKNQEIIAALAGVGVV